MAEEGYQDFEVEIDDELYAQIKVMAETAGITVDEWCTHAIISYLDSLVEEKEEDNG